jgi:hypothetical protein
VSGGSEGNSSGTRPGWYSGDGISGGASGSFGSGTAVLKLANAPEALELRGVRVAAKEPAVPASQSHNPRWSGIVSVEFVEARHACEPSDGSRRRPPRSAGPPAAPAAA